jgi:hypothetical protein
VRPRWVIALMIVMSGIGLALLGDLIPTAHKLDKWAALAESLIGVSLGLFGYPVFGRGAAIKPADDKQPPMSGAVVVLVLAAGMAMSACADPLLTCDKTSITVATTSAKGYKIIDLADEIKSGKLRERARVDAFAAQREFDEWREQRGIAFKVFDGGVAAVEGYTAARPEIAKAADKKKAAAPWIAALLKAASATAAKLAELEVIPGGAK